MKVLLLNGSPRQTGCTYTALMEIAKELEANGVQTELLQIGSKQYMGCTACRACKKTGVCAFGEADGVNAIAAKFAEADCFIFGSPFYYAGANGNFISFLNRLFFSCGKNLAHKPAAAIASARRAGTTASLDVLQKYFTISQMPVVSSTYWTMVHGKEPADVLKDEEGLQTMRNLAANMVWMLRCIEAGKSAGIQPPQTESSARTNFIR